jgi:uncharacterized protein YlxP (DUF503 family)
MGQVGLGVVKNIKRKRKVVRDLVFENSKVFEIFATVYNFIPSFLLFGS